MGRQRTRSGLGGRIFAGLVVAALSVAGSGHAADNRDGVAVIVGNKAYKGETPDVAYAHNDAEAMKRFVLRRLGFMPGNVIDLRDASKGELERVFGTHETHEGQLFDWVRSGSSEVLVFYSGHGVPGPRGRRSYLLPVDGDPDRAHITGYPVDLLYANLAKIRARSVTVYLDACFSGASPAGRLIRAASGLTVTPRPPDPSAGFVVLTAAMGDQLASWDEDAGHGLFTRHLLDALRGAADEPGHGDGDGAVTVDEVKRYLDEEMTYQARRRYGRTQTASVTGAGTAVLARLGGDASARKGIRPTTIRPASYAAPSDGINWAETPIPMAGHAERYRPGDTFKECAACPEMVVVPPGSFLMGTSADQEGRTASEGPPRRVEIDKPFAIGRFEVTFDEWDACVAGGGCNGYRPDDRGRGRGRLPVINVSWSDAKSFVSWLARKTGQSYRLLSESEWEYAARAGTTTRRWWGDDPTNRKACRYANVDDAGSRRRNRLGRPPHACDDGHGRAAPVGTYAANGFGLYDILGNVWEWVEDCWNPNHAGAPSNSAPRVSGSCAQRVIRGGSWRFEPEIVRSAYRDGISIDFRNWDNGFRIGRSLF